MEAERSRQARTPTSPMILEQRLFVRICRIPVELLHSSKLELRNPVGPKGFRQSFCAQAMRTAPDRPGCPPALKASPLSQQGYA
jgi:hypothetical protein